jgi:NADPH:quinone reductase-like Zn-dependent oxidoreductase
MANTHQAIAVTSKGVLESIRLPTPKPGPSEVVFKVDYASLIAFDAYQLDRNFMVNDYPNILGFNGAGTVVGVGSEVKDLTVGDRVRLSAIYSTSRHQ